MNRRWKSRARFFRSPRWLNSNKGTKSDMEVCPSPYSPRLMPTWHPRIIGTIQAANFGSLIPTESRRLSPEICCHESPSRWRLLAGAPLSSVRACWLMAPARSLSPETTTRLEPILCTTGSKKHELNLSKARSAGAISMSLLVPLLEFNLLGLFNCWHESCVTST